MACPPHINTELCFRDLLAHCHPIHRITPKPKTHFQDPIEHRTHYQIPKQNPKPPPTGANSNQIERPKNRRETAFEVFRPNHSRLSSFEHVKFSSEEGITSIKLEERCGFWKEEKEGEEKFLRRLYKGILMWRLCVVENLIPICNSLLFFIKWYENQMSHYSMSYFVFFPTEDCLYFFFFFFWVSKIAFTCLASLVEDLNK